MTESQLPLAEKKLSRPFHSDLETLAKTIITNGPHKFENTPRRVRILFGGQFIVDTTSARHVWEHKHFPQFWVPVSSVVPGLLTRGPSIDGDESASAGTLTSNGSSTDRVLMFNKGPLEGLVRFEFKAMHAWFEEDQQIYDHPKDPYVRIDILPSSRKIEVKIDGVTVAESTNSMFLYETGLRPRYYLPKTSVKPKYMRPSTTTTQCPYKGMAGYYSVLIGGKEHKDIIWWYKYPTQESAAVQGMMCFYNEKVDIYVDGVLEKK